MISDFTGKPHTHGQYVAIDTFVMGLGLIEKTAKSQISYSVNRKFLWLWAYEKTPDGTLYLNVMLSYVMNEHRIHRITQTSKNRWNHHVEVKSAQTAESTWLRRLTAAGYDEASQ